MKTESEMESEDNSTKVEIKDLGPDVEEDIKTQNQIRKMPIQIPIMPKRKMMGHGF